MFNKNKENNEQVKDVEVTANTNSEQEAQPPAPKEVNTGSLVSVNLKEDKKFKCGGKWYDLKKGVNKVPKDVKDVLMANGALKAI